MQSYDSDGRQIGPVVEGPDGQEIYWHGGRPHLGSAAGEREMEEWEVLATARSWGVTADLATLSGPIRVGLV